jgi:hypothetical protein
MAELLPAFENDAIGKLAAKLLHRTLHPALPLKKSSE